MHILQKNTTQMNIRNEICVLDAQKYAYTISTFYNRYKTQFSYLSKISCLRDIS